MAADDELLGACEEAAGELSLGADLDDPETFGAKVDRLQRRLARLHARIDKLETKEVRGLFRKMRRRMLDKRIARLRRRAEKLEAKLDASREALEDKRLGVGGGAPAAAMGRFDPDARDRRLHHSRAPTPYAGVWAPHLVTGARSGGPWANPDARDRALFHGWYR